MTGGGSTSWEGGGSTSWDTPPTGGGSAPPVFTVPQGLRDWLLQWDFQILTWHIDVGSYILAAIEWVLGPLNAIAAWIADLVAWWEEFRQEVIDVFNIVGTSIGDLLNWVGNITTMISDWIGNWWAGVYDTVKDWVLSVVQEVKDWVQELAGNIGGLAALVGDFFANTLPGLARMVDVDDWITARLEPFRDLFNWFEQFGTDVRAFFSDPLQWIYDHLEAFFERFW